MVSATCLMEVVEEARWFIAASFADSVASAEAAPATEAATPPPDALPKRSEREEDADMFLGWGVATVGARGGRDGGAGCRRMPE